MAWTYLLLAGACEIVATTVFRYVDGYTRLWPTLAFIAIGLFSFYLLNRSLAGIPLGSAYGIWTGIGAAGTAVVGMVFYGEPVTAMRLICLTMLIGGIVGLKLFE
jgi:quaternary ammonium compound-resistance protein SugE